MTSSENPKGKEEFHLQSLKCHKNHGPENPDTATASLESLGLMLLHISANLAATIFL